MPSCCAQLPSSDTAAALAVHYRPSRISARINGRVHVHVLVVFLEVAEMAGSVCDSRIRWPMQHCAVQLYLLVCGWQWLLQGGQLSAELG